MCYYEPFPPLQTIPDFMHFCQSPGIHLFISPGVLSVPQIIHDPGSCFNLLMPFCIPQYPWDMCKGSLALLWVGNPLTLPLAELAVFYKFLVVLISKAHGSYLQGLIKWA